MGNLSLNLYTLKSQFQGPKVCLIPRNWLFFSFGGAEQLDKAENTENYFQKMWSALRF